MKALSGFQRALYLKEARKLNKEQERCYIKSMRLRKCLIDTSGSKFTMLKLSKLSRHCGEEPMTSSSCAEDLRGKIPAAAADSKLR